MQNVAVIINAIISVLIFLGIRLIKNYLDEKGKNLASKEDLMELTKIVEQTKFEFTTQTEVVKSQLNVLTNIQTALKNEERNAIVDFNEKYFAWLHLLLNAGSLANLETTSAEIGQVRSDIRIGRSNLEKSHARLSLYLDDPEIIEKANGLYILTLVALPLLVTIFLSELQCNLVKIQIEPKNNEDLQGINRLTGLQIDSLKTFSNSITENYKPVSKRFTEFQTLCRVYLNKSN